MKTNNKIIELMIYQQIENSNNWINFLNEQIKFNQIQISYLNNNKTNKFQKKKSELHYNTLKQLEKNIEYYKKQIIDEIKLIEQMEKTINS